MHNLFQININYFVAFEYSELDKSFDHKSKNFNFITAKLLLNVLQINRLSLYNLKDYSTHCYVNLCHFITAVTIFE